MKDHQLINASSGDFEYYTPDKIVEAARRTLGGEFDLDPSSSTTANVRVKAKRIFEIPKFKIVSEINGLPVRKFSDWGGGISKVERPGMDESSFRAAGQNLYAGLRSNRLQKTRLAYGGGLAGKCSLDKCNRSRVQRKADHRMLYNVREYFGNLVSAVALFSAMLPFPANELLFAGRDVEDGSHKGKCRNLLRRGCRIVRKTIFEFRRCQSGDVKFPTRRANDSPFGN